MPAKKSHRDLQCSIANTLDVIGDHWTLLILRDAFMGVRRFDDFHRDLGIARNILSSRLNRLLEAGLMETRRYEEHPPRDEYLLTAEGKDLFDALLALWRWGDQWRPAEPESQRALIHVDCGRPTHLVPTCAHCGEELRRSNLRIEPGLEVVQERLARAADPAP